MGEVNRRKKHITLRIKRAKREKARKLVERLQNADSRERARLLEKLNKVAPFYPLPGTAGKR